MAPIYPVTSSRVSEMLQQQRLLSQFEFDRRELVRLQDQISTGYRLTIPSDDAPAATRAISLQRLLEQKQQAQTNVTTTQSYVAATDSALSSVSQLLANIRAEVLSAANSTNTADQRRVVSSEIRNAIEQLTDIGNRRFRGRFLFAGSQANEAPLQLQGNNIVYRGNETALRSVVDTGFLLDTNVTGNAAFGVISSEVRGQVDLNPILTLNTKLRDLRGGRGISPGSILVSDGTSSQSIDLSSAETVRDVIRLIESHAPTGREINVRLSSLGLIVDLDDAGGGNLTIREVANGSTASELGIQQTLGVGTAPLTGNDLDPRLTLTTRLDDVLGSRASAVLKSAASHNDIFIEAVSNGAEFNGVQVQLATGGVAGDSATATYDDVAKTLRINVNPGVTTAARVVDAMNATGLFRAQLDNKDDSANDGSGPIDVSAAAVTTGGAGTNFDRTSGLQITSGERVYTVAFDEAETIEDVLNVLGGAGAEVLAQLSADGRGLDVRSRLSGADFHIGENGGISASQLGIRTLTRETLIGDLNYGRGIDLTGGNDELSGGELPIDSDGNHVDFEIRRRDGTVLEIDVSSAVTIGDVIDTINAAAGETIAGLVAFGNGIEIVDNSTGSEPLTVTRVHGFAARDLGLLPTDADGIAGVVDGPSEKITGRDINPVETKGVFNSLLRLNEAILEYDLPEIERTLAMLDDDFDRVNFVRAEVGAHDQSLQALSERLEDEDVQLRATLSQEIDTDIVEAISNLTARQASMEATLRLLGQSLRMSLLDFL